MRRLIFFWRNNEALDFFIAEIRLAGLWGNKTKCLIISSEKNEVPHYFLKKNEAPHYFFRKKWGSSLFLQKKKDSSIFLQEKMRLLIIYSEKNEAPHYYFRERQSASLLLQEKIMRHFIFFWRNTEALLFFLKE